MPKQLQASLTGGEISPSLYARTDLQRFSISLATCRNFCVSATGGVFNRAGLEFVYVLDADSLAALIPFVFSTTQSYMLVFQEETIKVYTNGAYVPSSSPATVTQVEVPFDISGLGQTYVTTAAPHGFGAGNNVVLSGLSTIDGNDVNGSYPIYNIISPTVFQTIAYGSFLAGVYPTGGTATSAAELATPYLSEDLASLRYTQSADVVTIVNQLTTPYEFVRLASASFTFAAIADFEGGPFLDDNTTITTVTASATTGVVTLTATSAIFTALHVGALFRITIEDLSAIPPWEPNKFIAATGVDPDGLFRLSNSKVYVAANNTAAPASGTYTGTVAPNHDDGIQADGDLNLLNGAANTRAGVYWQYVHSLFGIARITAIGGGGTTATATVISTLPIVSPAVSSIWAFGAWSEDQGYPALVTYFGDRQVYANTPGSPQVEWASKSGEYHNFSRSSPLVANDAITQPLNARQINAIVELVPMEQLVALTSSSSWASPKRGETWTPTTIGYDPQSFDGAAFLRCILTGESAIFVQDGGTKVRDLAFKTENDKFRGDELTVMARHLFGTSKYIVDLDYAKEPHGILWLVRSDGALIGLTYLREQEVIGWHRHDTDGFFERVCVIPENGVDTPYFVVRRTVNGATVRYLERMAIRDHDDIIDSFFVDSGLTYDGRNTTSTTITIGGASYTGGASVTLTASAGIFAFADVDSDAIQFPSDDGNVRASITGFTSSTIVTATLQSPVPASLQAIATATWTFARDTFSGLGHLEGCTVAILADGSPEVPQVVVGGAITLTYPAGVVHIGLPYVSEIETLDINLFGAPESIRDNSKVVPKVSVMVEKTLGLQYVDNVSETEVEYDLGLQPADFDYTAPWPEQNEVQTGYPVTSWTKKGRVLLRQSQPLPATILSITPTVVVGENG